MKLEKLKNYMILFAFLGVTIVIFVPGILFPKIMSMPILYLTIDIIWASVVAFIWVPSILKLRLPPEVTVDRITNADASIVESFFVGLLGPLLYIVYKFIFKFGVSPSKLR